MLNVQEEKTSSEQNADGSIRSQLSEEGETQKQNAVSQYLSTVRIYEAIGNQINAPSNFYQDMFLFGVKNRQIPIEYPYTGATEYQFRSLSFNVQRQINLTSMNKNVRCPDNEGRIVNGTPEQDSIICSSNLNNASIYNSGPGDDTITHQSGPALIEPGLDNDIITLESTDPFILFLTNNWGQDVLSVDCTNANVDKSLIRADYPYQWDYPYKHFVVFEAGISRESIETSDTRLINLATGDELLFNQNCFNLVFLSE